MAKAIAIVDPKEGSDEGPGIKDQAEFDTFKEALKGISAIELACASNDG